MSTIQANQFKTSVNEIKTANLEVKTTQMSEFWKKAEFNRFGIIALLLVVVTCIAGFAAAIAVNASTFQLAAVAATAMAVEALILSVAPMKAIIISSVISVIVSGLVIFL
ncbi:MAG: hypothetical protein K0Q95_3074 [Bacteroidota bacterium]|jgi:hypothetical protein|nr:hypothetical protein [Bacteroidota bacterium]